MELVFIFYKGDHSLFKFGIFSAGEESKGPCTSLFMRVKFHWGGKSLIKGVGNKSIVDSLIENHGPGGWWQMDSAWIIFHGLCSCNLDDVAWT